MRNEPFIVTIRIPRTGMTFTEPRMVLIKIEVHYDSAFDFSLFLSGGNNEELVGVVGWFNDYVGDLQ